MFLHRDQVAASDSATLTDITKAEGVQSNDFENAAMVVKIEGTTPDVTLRLLIYDDDIGWVETDKTWDPVGTSFAAFFPVMGMPFFIHVTINAGSGVKVTVKVAGYGNRLQSA